MWRKGNPSALLLVTKTGAATVENSMEFPQKIKNEMLIFRLSQKNLCQKKFLKQTKGEKNIWPDG